MSEKKRKTDAVDGFFDVDRIIALEQELIATKEQLAVALKRAALHELAFDTFMAAACENDSDWLQTLEGVAYTACDHCLELHEKAGEGNGDFTCSECKKNRCDGSPFGWQESPTGEAAEVNLCQECCELFHNRVCFHCLATKWVIQGVFFTKKQCEHYEAEQTRSPANAKRRAAESQKRSCGTCANWTAHERGRRVCYDCP